MVGIMVAGALSLGGYFIYRSHKKDIENKIEKLLNGMKNETQHDSYSSYRRACDYGEQITTELDSSLFSAHAYLAYAYAIRWGEHGEDVADRAKDHLAKAKAAKTEHSHILAAEAYIDFFGGDAKAAEDLLQPIVDDKAKRSSLIMSTLGIIQMHDGDLEKAARNLKDAQTLAPSDPRINAAYGDVLRFQGLQEAAANA